MSSWFSWCSGRVAMVPIAFLAFSVGAQVTVAQQGADSVAVAPTVVPVLQAIAHVEPALSVEKFSDTHPVLDALPAISRPFVIDVVDDAPVLYRMPQLNKTRVVSLKKSQFFNTLRPIVRAENRRVAKLRSKILQLKDLHARQRLEAQSVEFLGEVAVDYRVHDFNPGSSASWDELLSRVDEVPLDMALAQAANESAWGSSRFAQQGNNLFGQWCFSPGCGIVPKRRAQGATHEVARFDTVNESVRSYIHILNTVSVYERFRALRAVAREQSTKPEGMTLVEGLRHYSERGHDYIDEIRAMIRINRRYIYAAAG